jgi:hypothetical protein
MGLFSKLFSREDEGPEGSQDENAPAAASDGEEGAPRRDAVADGSEPAAPSRGRGTPDEVVQMPGPTSSDNAGHQPRVDPAAQTQPGVRLPKDSPHEPLAAAKISPPPLKPGGSAKRDAAGPSAAKTVLGMGAPPPPGRAPRSAAQPAAAPVEQPKAPEPATSAEPAKTAVSPQAVSPQAARTQAAAARKTSAAGRSTTTDLTRPKRAPVAAAPTIESPLPSPPSRAVSGPLEAAVDAAMAALLDTTASPSSTTVASNDATDQRAIAETFAGMAKVHAQPLRELMFQLSVGRTPRPWAAASRAVLRPLLDAAQQIELLELVGALGAFDAALERAAAEPGTCIGDAAADALKSAYEGLQRQMPEAFTTPAGADNRRLILLESLLLQIPALNRRMLSKLYAAGLSSLSQLSQARPEELSVVAGIDHELALAVVEHIQRFERERSRVNPSAFRSYACERLRALVPRLSQLQADFERAEQDESMERKRAARRAREAAVLALDLLFAEIGDVDLIEELKRFPVRGKIRRVESYLEQLQASV